MAFDDGEIAAEVGKKNGQVEFVSQSGQRDSARFQLIRSSHIGAKPFLKRDDVFIELKKLTGRGMPGTQTLCAANARVVRSEERRVGKECKCQRSHYRENER